MRYYKQIDESGKLIAIGTGSGGIEITEAEYTRLLNEIRAKAELVDAVHDGAKTLTDVPAEWREEIARRVDERKQWEAEAEAARLKEEEETLALAERIGGKL